MTLTSTQVHNHAEEVRRTGQTMLPAVFPPKTIDAWSAAFEPLLDAAIATEVDDPNRGPGRFYVTLPFSGLWADPEIIDNDAVMAVVSELVGEDGVLCQLASDTPVSG